MAHFARVDQGLVTQVIVAEEEFISSMTDTSPGEWIQCSYNTHGGIHYYKDQAGNFEKSKDQSKSLRYNYPSVGWLYDKEADAFYPPCPGDGYELDTNTYTWKSIESKISS